MSSFPFSCVRALAVAALGLGSPAVLTARQEGHGAASHRHAAALGTIDFPNSGARAAQPAFLRGMAGEARRRRQRRCPHYVPPACRGLAAC